MRSTWVLLGAAGIGLANCTPTDSTKPPITAAAVGVIVCDDYQTLVKTPIVKANRKGVALRISNPGGAKLYEFHHESSPSGTTFGGHFQYGGHQTHFTMEPGRFTVACLYSRRSSYSDADIETGVLQVRDPYRLFVPWNLTCLAPSQSEVRIAAGVFDRPEDVFRRVPGVVPWDELRKPGYPKSPLHWPTMIVFRDGMPIARIGAPRIGRVWELLVDSCPGSGI